MSVKCDACELANDRSCFSCRSRGLDSLFTSNKVLNDDVVHMGFASFVDRSHICDVVCLPAFDLVFVIIGLHAPIPTCSD